MITPLYLVYAFENPDKTILKDFIEVVRSSLPDGTSLIIGISTDEEYESQDVQVFPVGHSIAQITNQLISRVPVDANVAIANGCILPYLAESELRKAKRLERKEFISVQARAPLFPPRYDGQELSKVIPIFDFTKQYQEITPQFLILTRSDFMTLRGFDERDSYKEIAFIDLFVRLIRYGAMQIHLDSLSYVANLNSYYKIRPSDAIPVTLAVQKQRNETVSNDRTIFRNLIKWSVPREHRSPLVSVAIATRNRAEYLKDSIHSIQNQTFSDWELILVDDGSEDSTEEVVRSFTDTRITYVYQPATGISSARNLAADRSSGYFTAVHDDDDIMLPWRLETSLNSITSEAGASYGSWVNFDNKTAAMALHITKDGFGKELVAYSGQTPGHATWLLPTDIVKKLRYDESLTSSVDHNLAVRTVMSGLRWTHTEKVLFIRRIHDSQVSVTDSKRQRSAAMLTRYASNFPMQFQSYSGIVEKGKALKFPQPADKSKLFEQFGLYLPDHLVKRSLRITGLVGKKVLGLDIHDQFSHIIAEQDLITDRSTLEVGGAESLTWADMVKVRESGFVGCQILFEPVPSKTTNVVTDSLDEADALQMMSDRILQLLQTTRRLSRSGVLLQLHTELEDPERLLNASGLVLARHLTINYEPYARESRVLLGFATLSDATAYVCSRDFNPEIVSIIAPDSVDFDTFSEKALKELQ